MANKEHLEILRQGVKVWNAWRKEHQGIRPNLRRANLTGIKLARANLKNANLSNANLSGVDLDGAHLTYADLSYAHLSSSNLNAVDLRKANLFGATLIRADLQEANLSHADLSYVKLDFANLYWANLSHAKLIGAHCNHIYLNFTYLVDTDFSEASIGWATFVDIDLRRVKGLEKVNYVSPSSIGIDTIYRSQGNIPEAFLKGAGIDDTFIEYIHSLVGKPIEYYSCFISYSSRDEAFAKRLYADLQSNNVRCWFAPEDLKIGDKFWHRIDESIRLYNKLLIVLSEHSVQSDWVEREVMAAFEKEKQGKMVLFPIMLDDAVKDCTAPWVADLRRQRHIGDFRGWKNHDDYQKAFERLLRDLRAPA